MKTFFLKFKRITIDKSWFFSLIITLTYSLHKIFKYENVLVSMSILTPPATSLCPNPKMQQLLTMEYVLSDFFLHIRTIYTYKHKQPLCILLYTQHTCFFFCLILYLGYLFLWIYIERITSIWPYYLIDYWQTTKTFFLMLLPTHGRTFFPITMWYLCIFSFIKRTSRGKFLDQLASPFDRFTEFPSKKAGLTDIYKYVYSNKTTLGIIT